MNARDMISIFDDDDTYRVLDITLTFLAGYFGHGRQESESLMREFFANFAQRFGEDAIHHESSYRMAAIIHYLAYLNGNPNELGDWLISSGHNQAPPEALEYFRKNYFA